MWSNPPSLCHISLNYYESLFLYLNKVLQYVMKGLNETPRLVAVCVFWASCKAVVYVNLFIALESFTRFFLSSHLGLQYAFTSGIPIVDPTAGTELKNKNELTKMLWFWSKNRVLKSYFARGKSTFISMLNPLMTPGLRRQTIAHVSSRK